jgi:mannose/fructose/N-acetylgalactosamine-specific phosphotransferase system component IIC
VSTAQLAALLVWGGVVGLDLVSVAQVMISRPFVAGTVAGFLIGDPGAGAMVGATLELFALDLLPIGAVRYPDYGPAAVAGAATAAGAPGILGLGPGVAVGLVVAYAGEWAIQTMRKLNSRDVQRLRGGLDAGDIAVIRHVHLRGILRDTVRALGVTSLGLAFAIVTRRWLPLGVRGVVLVSTVSVGAALAVAIAGALRLGGRGKGSAWLAAGLVIGGLWVLVR